MSWRTLEAEAPELAALARERLVRGFVLLGTIRSDGSPRISPVETVFVGGELVLATMRRSGKARDLRHDRRVVLHSPVLDSDGGEPELKLYGRLEPSDAVGGWWREQAVRADVYRLELEEAVHVEWDVTASSMRVRRWTPARGQTVSERAYP